MSVTRIDPQEAHRLMREEGFCYVDVRSEQEFALGHPAGAYNIPWQHAAAEGMRDNPDFMRTMRQHFPRDAKLVIGCRTGHRSLIAAERLLSTGFTAVVELRSGFQGQKDPFGRTLAEGWEACSLPVAYTPEAGRSYAELSGDEPEPLG